MSDALPLQGRLPTCPNERTLCDFASGKLPTATAETIAEHVGHCAMCETTLGHLDAQTDPLLAAVRKSADVEGASEADSRRVVQLVTTLFDEPKSFDKTNQLACAPEPSTAAVALRSGTELARIGCYQVLSKLGEGGMGTVYKARHEHLNKLVAVKLLSPDRVRDRYAVTRFQREMRAIGQLEHPNIVGARDAGESGGVHFLVMDYIDGLDLRTLARRVGPLPVAEACELIRQAAFGLQHVHENGLVHRDIKPSNLMLSRSGQVKLLDLGLALLAFDSAEDEPTTTCMTLGTLDYMAPEQANNSHHVDIRSDLYSLGCTLYRLLAGLAPFAAPVYDTAAKKLLAHATASVPRLRNVRPDVPAELDSIVQRLLAKAPSRRYQTPAEVMEALAPFAAGHDFSRLDSPSIIVVQPASRSAGPRHWATVAFASALSAIAAVVLLKSRDVEPPKPVDSYASGLAVQSGDPAHPTPLAARLDASPRRRAAEWVLSVGGSLSVIDAHQLTVVDDPNRLPRAPFTVQEVVLAHNEWLSDGDLVHLLTLGNLEALDLSYTAVSDSGLANLAGLKSLKNLCLNSTRVSDAGLAEVAKNRQLYYLGLGSTAITAAGLVHLTGLPQLGALELNNTRITDAGLERVCQLSELVDLRLGGTQITDAGLAQLPKLTKLQLLFVNDNLITDTGMQRLVELRKLTTLGLCNTSLTDVGLERLQELPNLTKLYINATRVTDAGIRKFQLARPHCQLDQDSKL